MKKTDEMKHELYNVKKKVRKLSEQVENQQKEIDSLYKIVGDVLKVCDLQKDILNALLESEAEDKYRLDGTDEAIELLGEGSVVILDEVSDISDRVNELEGIVAFILKQDKNISKELEERLKEEKEVTEEELEHLCKTVENNDCENCTVKNECSTYVTYLHTKEHLDAVLDSLREKEQTEEDSVSETPEEVEIKDEKEDPSFKKDEVSEKKAPTVKKATVKKNTTNTKKKESKKNE